MSPELSEMIARMQDLAGADDILIAPIGGLTKKNYLVTVSGLANVV